MLARLSLTLGLMTGCSSHCQQLCENMAVFAEDTCNIKVPETQINDCLTAFEDPTDDQEEACESAQDIKNEEGWTCELVEKYFSDDDEELE